MSSSSDWLLGSSLKILVTHFSPAYGHYFSIAIIRVSVRGGTRLLGKVETTKGKILTLAKQKQSKDHTEFAAMLIGDI